MPHTYVSGLVHIVFSTRNRCKCIDFDLQPKLWSYLGGSARQNGMKALTVGGMDDHAHLLLLFPGTITIAKAVQLLKGGSSKWINGRYFTGGRDHCVHPGPTRAPQEAQLRRGIPCIFEEAQD